MNFTRHRTKVAGFLTPLSYSWSNTRTRADGSADTNPGISQTTPGQYSHISMSDKEIPNFHSLPLESQPENPCTSTRTLYVKPTEVSVNVEYNTAPMPEPFYYPWWVVKNESRGTWAEVPTPVSTSPLEYERELRFVMSNVLLRARQHRMQLLVTLAESRKTLDLITGTLIRYKKRLSRLLTRHKRRRQRETDHERFRDEAEKTLLEFQFGWRPLISDIDSMLKAAILPLQRQKPQRFRSGSTAQSRSTFTRDFVPIAHGPWCRVTYEVTRTAKLQAGLSSIPIFDSVNIRNWGLDMPIGTVIELMTFSWAIDSFSNLFTILRQLDGIGTNHVTKAWSSIEVTTTVKAKSVECYNLRGAKSCNVSLLQHGEVKTVNYYRLPEVANIPSIRLPSFLSSLSLLAGVTQSLTNSLKGLRI